MRNNNKSIPLAIGILSFCLSTPLAAQASQFTSIYAFGDSLSDTGNVYFATGRTTPLSPPYYQGRFSNGPIWVEDLATSLGIPLENYAYGGATTGTVNIGSPLLPGLQQEIGLFANNHPLANPKALYTVWAGANDYLFTPVDPVNPTATPLSNIGTAIKNLSILGAKDFLVVNLPDLGLLPIVTSNSLPAPSSYYTALTLQHNAGLLSAIYAEGLPTDVKVTQLDVYSLANKIIQNPAQYGLTNVTGNCLDKTTNPYTLCTNPSQYFFWDDVHPTTGIHSIVAQQAVKAVLVPEPQPLNILGGISVIGLSLGLKRKSAQKISKSK